MSISKMKEYIAQLPVGSPEDVGGGPFSSGPFGLAADEGGDAAIKSVDVDKLPDGIVTGSNLIQFAPQTSDAIRSSVALSLLAAQRVATKAAGVQSPKQWFDRHNQVLSDLNWFGDAGGVVNSTFDSTNVAVHKAIIPFLTAAFGGAVTAGALILTALNQLKEIDQNSAWITLFDRQSRHFNVTEYQFSVAELVGDQVHLRIASARFDATYGQTQVLFFKVKKEKATFESASGSFATEVKLLTDLNGDLKMKLAGFTKTFIKSLPDDLGDN